MIKHAVILVGGKGSRLKELTKKTPKPLIRIGKSTFLDLILKKLSKYYFEEIYLMAGFKGDVIKKKYHNKKILFSTIKVIVEKKTLGTGGCLNQLKNKINSNFLVFNGDSNFDLDLQVFIKKSSFFFKKKNFFCSMALVKNTNYKSNKKLANLSISKKNILSFKKDNGLMNSGVYIFDKNIFKLISNKKISLEDQILPKIILDKKTVGFNFNSYFIDIGIKKNLKLYRSKIKKDENSQKCVFFDRDGVINKLDGYVTSQKKFKILPGVENAIQYLNKKNILVIIITNQSAVGRGMITENNLNKLHLNFCLKIKKKNSSYINDIYYCPYIKNAKIKKYNKNSIYRKPKPGMLLKAIKDWGLLKKNCVMIGDQNTDQLAAKKSGIKFLFKNNQTLYEQVKKIY